MNNFSPVVLFVYNRHTHTKRTIEALQSNRFASNTVLYIYSDAAVGHKEIESVKKVREYIRGVRGFRHVEIIERENNFGLAASIIDGVTTVMAEHGRAIVLEDDLVTSPYFLEYMNKALEHFKDEKRVWHVSGWSPPIGKENEMGNTFLWRTMHCWGWATWEDRWRHFEKNTEKLVQEFSKKDIRRFNLDGAEDFWSQIVANRKGKIDTWAIFWYATIFKHNGLCLNPAVSYVKNIGLDGSGVHCGNTGIETCSLLNGTGDVVFPTAITESEEYLQRIRHYYKSRKTSLPIRVLKRLGRKLIGRRGSK